jgi:hypothetical protein
MKVFKNDTVPEIQVSEKSEAIDSSSDEHSANNQNKRINRLFCVIGTAKDKNKTFDKHDVYDQ